MDGTFSNPRRFSKNVDGPFYTTGDTRDGKESGDCLWCGLPEFEAPDLLAELDDTNSDTYFVRQPDGPDEIERACSALEVCCVEALRYGGKDSAIIARLGNTPDLSDYVLTEGSEIRLGVDPKTGEPLSQFKWWQFWRW